MRGLGIAGTLLLGAAMLAPAAVADGSVQEPWGTTCDLAWCDDTPQRVGDGLEAALKDAARVAELAAGRNCTTPEDWPRKQIPGGMVWKPNGGSVQYGPWTYPAPAGSNVLRLCA